MKTDSRNHSVSPKASDRVGKSEGLRNLSKNTDLRRTMSFDSFSNSRASTPEQPQRKTGMTGKSLDLHDEVAVGSAARLCTGVIRQQGQQVYVKSLKQKDPSAELLADLSREATLHQNLNHANIIKCVGARLRPPRSFIVFQATPIGTLRNVLDKPLSYPLTWKDRLLLAKDIASGIGYLHNQGIFHGDLKTFNVLLYPDHGRLTGKLMEFGAVKFRVHFDQEAHPDRLHRSLAWNPPEAIHGHIEKSARGDVYSFGLVLYELATGRLPYADKDAYSTRNLIIKGMHPKLPRDCPDAFVQLFQQCVRLQPEDRPDVSQLFDSLSQQIALLPGPDSEMLFEPQPDYLCALSGEVMLDPVKVDTGVIYERKAIEMWFASGKRTCPVTHAEVRRPKSLEPCRDLQLKIKDWHAKQLQKAKHKMRSLSDVSDDASHPLVCTHSYMTDSAKMHDTSSPITPSFDLTINRLETLVRSKMTTSAPASPYQSSLATTPYLLETPTPTTATESGSPFAPSRNVKAILAEVNPVAKGLASKLDCDSKRIDAHALIELARRGYLYRLHLVKAGVVPQLAKMFKCSHSACQKVAIHAMRVLVPREDEEEAVIAPPRGFRRLMMKVTCSMGAFGHSLGPDAVQQLVDTDGLKTILKILEGPPCSVKADALMLLLSVASCPQYAAHLSKYSVIQRLVAVMQGAESPPAVASAVHVLLKLIQANSAVCFSAVSAGAIEPLILILNSQDGIIASRAAWILAALADDEDTKVAIGKDTASIAAEMLRREETQEAAVALIRAIATYDYSKHVLLQSRVVHWLVAILKTRPTFSVSVMDTLCWFTDSAKSCKSLVAEGAVEMLLGMLQSADSSPAVAEKAVELLYHLIPVTSASQQVGIIPVVTLCLSRQHESCHAYACKSIARLASASDGNKVAVADVGGLPHLANMLKTGKVDVRAAAAEVLASLAVMSEYSGIVKHYGMMREVHGMLSLHSPLSCRVAAVDLLRNMAKWEVNHACIVDAIIVPQLVVLLKDRVVRAAVLDIVLSLSLNHYFINDVIESGIVPRLLPMTVKHEKCQQSALELLQLFSGTSLGREAVVKANAIPVLAKAMHGNNKVVKDMAAQALCDIAADGRFQVAVAKENVIGLLVELLRRSDWTKKRLLVTALANLARVDSTCQYNVVTAGAVPPLIQFLDDDDSQLKMSAALALGDLGYRASSHQKMIASRGALTPLVAMLQSSDSEEQTAAVEAVMKLTKNNASTQLLATEEGAVDALVKLLISGPPACKTSAALALANLTFDENVRKMLASTSG